MQGLNRYIKTSAAKTALCSPSNSFLPVSLRSQPDACGYIPPSSLLPSVLLCSTQEISSPPSPSSGHVNWNTVPLSPACSVMRRSRASLDVFYCSLPFIPKGHAFYDSARRHVRRSLTLIIDHALVMLWGQCTESLEVTLIMQQSWHQGLTWL